MGNLIRGIMRLSAPSWISTRLNYLFCKHARAAIFAILIGSGIEP